MQRYETLITTHGTMKPRTNRNFFGLEPFFLNMVHEKVAESSPKVPQMPNKGGSSIRKLRVHMATNISVMPRLVYN